MRHPPWQLKQSLHDLAARVQVIECLKQGHHSQRLGRPQAPITRLGALQHVVGRCWKFEVYDEMCGFVDRRDVEFRCMAGRAGRRVNVGTSEPRS